MRLSFPCKNCGFGKFNIDDSIDSGMVVICRGCEAKYVIDLWEPKERTEFFNAADRGGYVKEKGQISHTCPNCNHTFHA
jgi:rubrerythrin